MSQPEDIFLKQLEYPVECPKDILNHSEQDLKNVNCEIIYIKEEFTHLEPENEVEGKYEDIYGCSNQLNILEHNKEGDFIIETDEGMNDVHIEPTENAIVAELNKSVNSSTFRKRRRKSKISFSCDLCNSSFTTKSGLIIHIRQHLGDNPYQCHHCHVRYARKNSLVNHMKFIHMKILNRYRCDRCRAQCASRKNLIRHVERYHLVDESNRCNEKKRRLECYHCGDTFCNKFSIVQHMRRHTGERPYSCSYCRARFRLGSNLVGHVRRHTGERPYKCDQCNAEFALKSGLTKHMKIHTGEKHHQCRYCMVKFAQKSNLVTHERIHSNDKPYRCEKCIDRFTRSAQLKDHMKTHTNDGPYMCSGCKVGFNRKISLNRHLKIHELEDASNPRRQFSGKLKN